MAIAEQLVTSLCQGKRGREPSTAAQVEEMGRGGQLVALDQG